MHTTPHALQTRRHFLRFSGNLLRVGAAREQVARYEYRRVDHVTEHDRKHVLRAGP